jgi:hypothetical protein
MEAHAFEADQLASIATTPEVVTKQTRLTGNNKAPVRRSTNTIHATNPSFSRVTPKKKLHQPKLFKFMHHDAQRGISTLTNHPEPLNT